MPGSEWAPGHALKRRATLGATARRCGAPCVSRAPSGHALAVRRLFLVVVGNAVVSARRSAANMYIGEVLH
jgi:hypothetical protein